MSVYRLTIQEKMDASNEARNVFHYEYTPGIVPGHADWLALATTLATAIAGCIDVSANIYGYTVHLLLEPSGKFNLIDNGELDIDGVRTGESLPYQVAAVVLGYTAISKHIAKKWLGPISETDQAGGVIVQALDTALQAFGTAWKTPYTQGGINLVPHSWSKTAGPLQITSCICPTILGTQRRRKPGRGI